MLSIHGTDEAESIEGESLTDLCPGLRPQEERGTWTCTHTAVKNVGIHSEPAMNVISDTLHAMDKWV